MAEPREWPREQRREPRPEPGDGGRAEGLQPPAESHSQPTARWQDVNTPPLIPLTSSPASHSREPAPTGSWRAGRPQGQRGDARPGLDAGGRRRHPTRCPFSLLLSPPHVFPAFSPSERLVQLSFHLMPACSSSLPPPLPESSVAKGDAETRNKERWFSSFLCVRSFKNHYILEFSRKQKQYIYNHQVSSHQRSFMWPFNNARLSPSPSQSIKLLFLNSTKFLPILYF